MANALISDRAIVAEMLRVLQNKSALLGKVNTQYSDQFGREGGKVGSTINVRKPPMFTVRSGPVANIQDVTEAQIPITIQPEFGIDFQFSDYDLTLTIDKFSERYIRPAASRLATELDYRIVSTLYKDAHQSVGTPGTPPASAAAAQLVILQAGQKLTEAAAPQGTDERMMVWNPSAATSVISQLNTLFNHQRLVGEQYRTGELGEALGFMHAQSANMPNHTVGPLGGTPLVNGANQGTINSGSTDNPYASTTSLVTNGWTAAAAARLKKGDIITIAGVNAVNVETKQSTGTLQQFTVTADVSSDGAGNATLIISPAIIAGGAFQNVTARPANGAAITVLGAANTSYGQNLAFVKDAFTLVTVDMELPKGMDMAARAENNGVSMRFVRGFDITNNRRISRFDILAGYATLRPEWAVRVAT